MLVLSLLQHRSLCRERDCSTQSCDSPVLRLTVTVTQSSGSWTLGRNNASCWARAALEPATMPGAEACPNPTPLQHMFLFSMWQLWHRALPSPKQWVSVFCMVWGGVEVVPVFSLEITALQQIKPHYSTNLEKCHRFPCLSTEEQGEKQRGDVCGVS